MRRRARWAPGPRDVAAAEARYGGGLDSGCRLAPRGAGPGATAAAAGAGGPPAGASSSVSMIAISALLGTVAPSSARISLSTPANGEGTSAFTLSVITSTSGSYFATVSPGCLSQRPIVPSATLSPSWGIVTLATGSVPPMGAVRGGRDGALAPSVAHPATARLPSRPRAQPAVLQRGSSVAHITQDAGLLVIGMHMIRGPLFHRASTGASQRDPNLPATRPTSPGASMTPDAPA